MLIAGIIVSGGAAESARKLVEIFREDGTICTLPDLPADRSSHSQSGWIICGGADGNAALQTCTTLEDGAWVESHNLSVGRKDHLSWRTSAGDIILIGGSSAQTIKSTELLSGTSSANGVPFSLEYNTRKACVITLPETHHIVITGGQMLKSNRGIDRVQIYGINGKVSTSQLPQLKEGRFQHACAYYFDNLGQVVSFSTGRGDDNCAILDFSQMHLTTSHSWTYLRDFWFCRIFFSCKNTPLHCKNHFWMFKNIFFKSNSYQSQV